MHASRTTMAATEGGETMASEPAPTMDEQGESGGGTWQGEVIAEPEF